MDYTYNIKETRMEISVLDRFYNNYNILLKFTSTFFSKLLIIKQFLYNTRLFRFYSKTKNSFLYVYRLTSKY